MREKIRSRLSFANVVSVVALFLALGGSAVAAKQMITGKDIVNGSIAAKDLSKQLRKALARQGSPGAAGVPGPPGAPGERGPVGPAGPSLGTAAQGFWSTPIVLDGTEKVVASSEEIPSGNGLSGGPIQLPAAGGQYTLTGAGRVELTAGTATCALQMNFNGGSYSDLDRATSSGQFLRLVAIDGNFPSANASPLRFGFRIVCTGSGSSVKDARFSVVVAYEPPGS